MRRLLLLPFLVGSVAGCLTAGHSRAINQEAEVRRCYARIQDLEDQTAMYRDQLTFLEGGCRALRRMKGGAR
jgi:hypothetical protein